MRRTTWSPLHVPPKNPAAPKPAYAPPKPEVLPVETEAEKARKRERHSPTTLCRPRSSREEAMADVRQYEAARMAQQDARGRTLEQHDAHLRTFGTGDADYAAKRGYMLDHGLEYRDGVLCHTPSTVHREAAWEAKRRVMYAGVTEPVPDTERHRIAQALAAQNDLPGAMLGNLADGVLGGGVARTCRAPGKTFSRSDILAIIAAERTKWVDEPTEIGGMRYRAAMQALDEMQRIFENLE